MLAARSAHKVLALFAFLVAASVAAVAGASVLAPQPDLEAADVEMLNEARANNGVAPLAADPRLVAIAERHARGLVKHHAFSHNRGLSRDIHRAGICASGFGENIAYRRDSGSVASKLVNVHRSYMSSPDHRDNILRGGFKRVGVGVVKRGGAVWNVEVFVAPC